MGIPLNFAKRQEVLDYVRKEFKEYRAGNIDYMSRDSEIAAKVGISKTSVSKYLNSLTPRERYFRICANSRKMPQSQRKRFLKLARRKPDKSIAELARLVGISESTADYVLPKKLKEYRRNFRESQKVEKISGPKQSYKIPAEDKSALIELVREEFQMYEAGELERFTTSHELAALLGNVKEATVRYHLRRSLSKEEQKLRNLVIIHGNNSEAIKKAELFDFASAIYALMKNL